jgi:hypothetical protein
VHTPEFAFEKERENVVRATEKYGVAYPVVMDNDYGTWRAYSNRYWPRKYIIDIDGFIVYDHIGEGAYEETETLLQSLLKERAQVLGTNDVIDDETTAVQPKGYYAATPEIYFGYRFSRNQLGNSEGWRPNQDVSYSLPEDMERNMFYLNGTWRNNEDNMEAVTAGTVELRFSAKSVNVVAQADAPTTLQVFVDGKPHRNVTIGASDLYEVADVPPGPHRLTLLAQPGTKFYTFTFG